MEQKKTLWIIAAVGAFLLVVLGAAWIIYTPKTYNASPAVAKVSDRNYEIDVRAPGDRINREDKVPVPPAPGFENKQINAEKVDVLANNASLYVVQKDSNEATTIDLNELKMKTLEQANSNPQNINVNVTLDTNKGSEDKVSVTKNTEQTVQTVKKTSESAVSTVKKSAEPVKKSSSASKTNTTVTKTNTTANKASAVQQEKKITQYWVQVAAYGDKKHAENARTVLDSNKIPADIFTFKDNKGKLFYRVRVGPYTTKSEAEYWRTRIIKIDDFSKAESYVTSTTN